MLEETKGTLFHKLVWSGTGKVCEQERLTKTKDSDSTVLIIGQK